MIGTELGQPAQVFHGAGLAADSALELERRRTAGIGRGRPGMRYRLGRVFVTVGARAMGLRVERISPEAVHIGG